MANKKELKRSISAVCSELFAEGVATSLYGNQENQSDVEALLSSILVIHSDFIRRVSHPEPGMPQKKYFKTLVEDFNKQVSELADQISNN